MPFDPLEHETPPEDLAALDRLAELVGGSAAAVEVGSWVGSTALVLAKHFDRVYCVDTWEGTPSDSIGAVAARHGSAKVLDTFCANVGPRLLSTVVPIVGRSLDWARRWPFQVNLIFLDADHDYEAVAADIRTWMPHVQTGGILCGHDWGWPGVTRAVGELVPGYRVDGTVWWAYV